MTDILHGETWIDGKFVPVTCISAKDCGNNPNNFEKTLKSIDETTRVTSDIYLVKLKHNKDTNKDTRYNTGFWEGGNYTRKYNGTQYYYATTDNLGKKTNIDIVKQQVLIIDQKKEFDSSQIPSKKEPVINNELPYLYEEKVIVIAKYNPKYGDSRICKCGHEYGKHFDTCNNMEVSGCKYCGCPEFDEKVNTTSAQK